MTDSCVAPRLRALATAAAFALGACWEGDECSLPDARCGSERGTYETCFEGGHHSFAGGPNRWVQEDCPGIDPVCVSVDDQPECRETAEPEPCENGAVVVADAPGDVVVPRVADLDADGLPDLLLRCSELGTPSGIFRSLQAADGSFSEPVELASADGSTYVDARSGDVDGDGRTDVVALQVDPEAADSLQALVVLLSRGDELVAVEPWPAQSGDWLYELADLDGEGGVELLLGTAAGVAILGFDGDALVERDRWHADPGVIGERIAGLTVVDFAGDGRPTVLLETGVQFHPFVSSDDSYVPGPHVYAPSGSIFADFDGDGATDVVYLEEYQVRPLITLAISDRNGDFELRGIGHTFGRLAAAQLGRKRLLDLVAFHDPERMSVFLDAAGPGERERRTFALPHRSVDPVLADLDGDGRIDIVAGRGFDPEFAGSMSGEDAMRAPAVVATFGACF